VIAGLGSPKDGAHIPILKCELCARAPSLRESNGCTAPKPGGPWRSWTDDGLRPRRRCPRALLNPETDHFDPTVVAMLQLANFVEANPGRGIRAPVLDDEPVHIAEGVAHVRGVWARMQSIRWERQRENQSSPGGSG
jgi:hypothetical protein